MRISSAGPGQPAAGGGRCRLSGADTAHAGGADELYHYDGFQSWIRRSSSAGAGNSAAGGGGVGDAADTAQARPTSCPCDCHYWHLAIYRLLRLQALESPLLVAVAAGSVALPTLLKLAEVLTAQKQDFVIGEQLPVEVDLGKVRKTSTDTRTTLEVPRKFAFLSFGSWFAAAEAGLFDRGAAACGGRTGQGEDAT